MPTKGRGNSLALFLGALAWRAVHGLPNDPALFRTSSDVGISRCSMKGVSGGERVMLHMWLRFIASRPPGSSDRASLAVRGFALLESVEEGSHWWPNKVENCTNLCRKQTNAATALKHFSNDVCLRTVPRHGKLDLNRTLRLDVVPPIPQPGGRAGIEDPIFLSGLFDLHNATATGEEFEVRAGGMFFHCPVFVPFDDNSPAARVEGRPLGVAGQTTFLIGPIYNNVPVDSSVFVPLLLWHIAWHRRLSVDLFVIYTAKHLPELLENRAIQDVIKQGLLKVVVWRELPLNNRKHESHFGLIYNHGHLSLWANDQDSLVLHADLDEFLIMPRPMSVRQMFAQCAASAPRKRGDPTEGPVGLLHVMRDDIAHAEYLQQRRRELPAWVPADLRQAMLEGKPWSPDVRRHPLLAYSVSRRQSLGKEVVKPSLTMRLNVHFGEPVAGAAHLTARRDCVRFLHLPNLFRIRMWSGNQTDVRDGWLWPALSDGQ